MLYPTPHSSIEGKTCLRRGRLVYGEGDSSTEGETRLQRGRFVYEGKTCMYEDKGQRTRYGGTEDRKLRRKGQEQWNRATKKVDRQGTEERQ